MLIVFASFNLVIRAMDIKTNAESGKNPEQLSGLTGCFSILQVADETDAGVGQPSQLRLDDSLLTA